MSKHNTLLVQGDFPLITSPTLAKALGVPAATFLQKLHYFLNQSEVKVFQNRKYYFHSLEQWTETLGIYSVSTMKRIIKRLKELDILIVKKLSHNKWQQTNYYAINYKQFNRFMLDKQIPVASEQVEQETAQVQDESADSDLPQHTVESPASPKLSGSGQANRPIITARESRPLKEFKSTLQQTAGLPSPLNTFPSVETLQQMPQHLRQFYHALLRLKVDVDCEDTRLLQWVRYERQILQHIAFIKDGFGHTRHQWHSPEQLEMQKYTI